VVRHKEDAHCNPSNVLCSGTAIETPLKATIRLTVLKGTHSHVQSPHFITKSSVPNGEEYYCTTGVASGMVIIGRERFSSADSRSPVDMREATRSAARSMIEHLRSQRGLSREDAYMLCSVAGDLRLHEVVSNFHFVCFSGCPPGSMQVDMPNYLVRHLHLASRGF
jgi:acetamidase/formamidase